MSNDASRAFREIGNALVDVGRRLNVGKELEAMGRQMRDVARDGLPDDLTSLRRPVDELRALTDGLATTAVELRVLVEALAAVVGVDKEN